jgi:NodT family efflux transporter outer membrane factor (OMF) lipoprotein
MTVITLAGCSLAPDYAVPEASAPPAFKEQVSTDGWEQAQPSAAFPRGEWWRVFNDPILNTLEDETTDANQNLRAALDAYEQARSAVDAASSALFPVLNADASSTRERESRHRPLYSSSSPVNYNDDIASLDATYEVDVFGRLRNTLAEASAEEQASRDDLETLNLQTHIDVATDYFQLREQDALIRIYADTVKAYKDALELTQQRFDQGLAAGLDVAQAKSQLDLAESQAEAVSLARSKLEHAIALLIGESSSTFTLAPGIFNPDPPVIPAGMPSDLLQRRPDIAAAERRVSAANADIGIAEAAFYPTFEIDMSGGFEGNAIRNWIEAPSRFWSIGPSGALTLFDAGKREAILAEAGEGYNQQVADYRQTVLTAYRDVEDALASIRQLDREAVDEDNAVKDATLELGYANDRYTNGLNEYLDVVNAQTTLLTAERGEEDVLADRLNARVALIQALGGGWGPVPAPQPVNPDPASLQNIGKPGSVFELLRP